MLPYGQPRKERDHRQYNFARRVRSRARMDIAEEVEMQTEDEIYGSYLNGISGVFMPSKNEPLVQRAAYAMGVVDGKNNLVRSRNGIVKATLDLFEPK